MKLKKENFNKSVEGDTITYSYECDGNNFFIVSKGGRDNRQISVYKEVEGQKGEEFNTSDSLEAWNYFEQILEECAPQQGSSGGFAKNPQENPNILPLLAIKRLSDGRYGGCLFAQLEDKSQVKIFDFFVDSNAMPSPIPSDVFVVDWSDEEVNMLLKCEMAMKTTEIVFEEDTDKQVFLFIPKSITNQGGDKGGEEGGDEDGGDEGGEDEGGEDGKPSDKKGKPSKKKGKPSDEGGEPTDEDGEPTDEKGKPSDKKGKGKPSDDGGEPTDEDGEDDGGEPSDKKGKPTDKKGKPTDNEDEPTDDEGEPTDEDGKPTDKESDSEEQKEDKSGGSQREIKLDFGDTIQTISNVTGVPSSSIISFFRTPTMGESFLRGQNFSKIKEELNLPNLTPKQLTEQIINSKKN